MVNVVVPEPPLDAEPVVVGGAVAPFHRENPIVGDLVRQLTADAAIGAKALDLSVWTSARGPFGVEDGRRQQRARRARLDALAAADAGTLAHRVGKVEDDRIPTAALGHADDVVDLDLSTGPDAEVAVDAGVKLNGHRGVAAIRRRNVRAGGEARGTDADRRGPPPEPRIGIVRPVARGLVGKEKLEHQRAGGFRAV